MKWHIVKAVFFFNKQIRYRAPSEKWCFLCFCESQSGSRGQMPLSCGLHINAFMLIYSFTRGIHVLFCFKLIFLSLSWCLQMLIKAVCVDVCASSSSSSPFIPSVLTFSPNEAATLGSHVSCHRQSCSPDTGWEMQPAGTVNYINILIYYLFKFKCVWLCTF